MTDRDVVAENARVIIGEVQHGIVLNVAVMTNDDTVDVTAKHSVIPDAGVIAERDVADNDTGRGDIDVLADGRFFAEKFIQLLF